MAALSLVSAARGKKAVFLDMDNTLYAYAPCHAAALQAAFRAWRRITGKALSRSAFLRRYEAAKKEVKPRTRGQACCHSRLLYFKEMLDMAGLPAGPAVELEKVYWDTFIRKMRLKRWTLPFLKAMRREKIRVFIITDMTARIQLLKIRKLGLWRWIDGVITSEEAGAEKPSPAIFRLALRRASCRPSEVLLIGDDPQKDRCAGMDHLLL